MIEPFEGACRWVLAHLPAENVPASRCAMWRVIPYRSRQAVLVLVRSTPHHHEGGRDRGGLLVKEFAKES